MDDNQSLGTPAAEPANFDDRLASLIGRSEGIQPAPTAEPEKTPAARDAAGRFMKTDANGYQTEIRDGNGVEGRNGDADGKAAKDPGADPKGTKVDDNKAAAAKADDQDEEDYLELPAEKEGEQPTRLKIADVLAGFNEAKSLKGEVETLRTASRQMPAAIEKELSTLVENQTQYVNGLRAISKMMEVPEPDARYLDPNSGNYSPETYYAQLQRAQQIQAMHGQMKTEAERVEKEQKANNLKLHNARVEREMQSLLKAWPEFADRQVQEKFVADAGKEYGLTAEEIASVTNARDYQILRDALAYRAGKLAKETATAEAVKIVKAKPKLVRGSARQPSGKQAAYSDALDRLSRSHSDDDGVAAIKALIS